MVCNWGMSPKLGMVEYGESEPSSFLGTNGSKANYSGATAKIIDEEIKRFIDEAYDRATQLLTQHRDKLDLIAKALIEYETLDGEQITDLLKTGEMKNPPQSPQPPEVPDEDPAPPQAPVTDDLKDEDDETLGGELVGAPA